MVGSIHYILCTGDHFIILRQLLDRVTVTHPYLGAFPDIVKQLIAVVDEGKVRSTVFPCLGRTYLTSKKVNQVLSPVTDPQKWLFSFYPFQIRVWCIPVTNGMGAARQDHGLEIIWVELLTVEWMDLTVNVELSHAPGDELRDL